MRRRENDAVSVRVRVEEVNESYLTPILFYKKQKTTV